MTARTPDASLLTPPCPMPLAARRRLLRWALAGVGACGLAACQREPGAVNLVKLAPPEALPLQDRGAFELALQQCESDVLRLLGAGAGKHPELERYRVPSATAWGPLCDFYAGQLPSPWQRSASVPEQQAGFRLRVWQRSGPGAQRLAVALLDAPAVGTQSSQPFRMLVVASEGG
jgi:hypothetical protein